jgi:hypothetical protein
MRRRDLHPDRTSTLKKLRLGKLLPVVPERLRQAREQAMEPEDFLLLLLSDEVGLRQRLTNRAKVAGLVPSLVFEEWDSTVMVT